MASDYDLFHVDSEGRAVRVEFYVTEGGDARIKRMTQVDDLGHTLGFEFFRTVHDRAFAYDGIALNNEWMLDLANSDELKWALVRTIDKRRSQLTRARNKLVHELEKNAK